MNLRTLFKLACLLLPSAAGAACPGIPAGNADAFARLPGCASDAFALRAAFLSAGKPLRTTMVANRGFHNPADGSFSFFEMAGPPGDLFFGHFTAVDDQGALAPDQAPAKGALMVELIGWDPGKRLYNFYELIGNGQAGQWFYRGDGGDIRADLQALHLQKPSFGPRLRCSGCHLAGGPIMKELASPHNDWWEPVRKLPFAQALSPALRNVMQTLVPADELAQAVRVGQARLTPPASLREKLRPLFCPMEVNFESDALPLEAGLPTVEAPRGFFVDPRLSSGPGLAVPRAAYLAALAATHSVFPEDGQSDSDHAWLTPVKATTDQLLTIVDDEFVADVLAVNFTNPLTSTERCGLLPLVPETEGPHWQAQLIANLKASPSPAARTLLENLTDPARTAASHRQRAEAFIQNCVKAVNEEPLAPFLALKAQRVAELRANAISQNPRGQILEPGFRVIFPEVLPAPVPGAHRLDESCHVR